MSEPKNLVAVSYGGGIQSTAIAHLVINKDPRLLAVVPELPSVFVFADTGDEPEAVYSALRGMRKTLEGAGIKLLEVKKKAKHGKSISEDILERARAGLKGGGDMPPVFTLNPDGTQGHLHRQCTVHWKVKIIHKALKEEAGLNLRKLSHRDHGVCVDQWLGISTDEVSRMRTPSEAWLKHTYPLIEMGWTRANCISYLDELGIQATRSACVYCPFQSDAEWKRLKTTDQEGWKKAVEFEKELHTFIDIGQPICGLKNRFYFHRSMVPLEEADFNNQLDLFGFDEECAGVCGV
tara:strand:+ start:5512 stop:6390 length:879 start_codon:yes stop_codon:yes gene_type:complete